MPTTITHGLASFTADDYLDEVKIDFETEVSERRGTSGAFTKVNAFNPTNSVNYKGGGNPAQALGVQTVAITGLTGGVKVVNKYEHTEHNNEFDDYEVSLKHYPGATAG
jgi:hypothetical protein